MLKVLLILSLTPLSNELQAVLAYTPETSHEIVQDITRVALLTPTVETYIIRRLSIKARIIDIVLHENRFLVSLRRTRSLSCGGLLDAVRA